jgi:predicted kinase
VTTLVVICGLPASGKTTLARALVADREPDTIMMWPRVRLNRDDFRTMMFGGWTGLDVHETAVTVVQRAAVRAALRAGMDVVVDDTNLHPAVMAAWRKLAADVGADVVVWDLTYVPLDECLARNEGRAGTAAYVPPDVIRDMAARYLTEETGSG